MAVLVRKFVSTSLERSVISEDLFHSAEATRLTPNGDLEVLEINMETTIVRMTYSAGHWIDAQVARYNVEKGYIWQE